MRRGYDVVKVRSAGEYARVRVSAFRVKRYAL